MISTTHEIGRIDSLVKTVIIQFSIQTHPRVSEITEISKRLDDETRSESVVRGQKVNGAELFHDKDISLSMMPLDLEESLLQLVRFASQQRVDRRQNSRRYTMMRFVFVPEARLGERRPEFEDSIPEIEIFLSNLCTESLWIGRGYDNPSGDEEDETRFLSLNFEFPGPREKALKDSNGQLTGEIRQLARSRLSIHQGLVSAEPI